jgi:hypothetical protein
LLTGVLLAVPTSAPAEHRVPELITTGPGPGGGQGVSSNLHVSSDGRRVLFSTFEPFVPEDVDRCVTGPEPGDLGPCQDGYQRFGGTTSLLTTGPTDPHGGVDVSIDVASRDRTRVFFNTSDPLVPDDTNGAFDAYERHAGTTTLVSTGPSGPGPRGSSVAGASEDGSRVFFFSGNRLTSEDTDDCRDLYERSAGTTKLVSTGVPPVPTNFGGCAQLDWAGVSADGSRVFLITDGKVTTNDPDGAKDIYQWSGGEASLITTGPADQGLGSFIDFPAGISRDGRHVFFRTSERLVPEDTDTAPDDWDLYERFDGTTSLVVPPAGGNSSPQGFFAAISEDSSHVFFSTAARLVPEDTDDEGDLYERVDGEFRLVGTGPLGSSGATYWAGPYEARTGWGGLSADGRAVVFASAAPLVPEDTDTVQDLYLRANGETKLVSTGPNDVNQSFNAMTHYLLVAPDGSRMFFTTDDAMVAEDTDGQVDVYEWHAGVTTIVPDGISTSASVFPADVFPRALVGDGSRVFIGTTAALTPNDTDTAMDIYAVDLPNRPPACGAVAVTPGMLWPANGRLVPIALSGATDPDGDDVTLEITGVTQDEPTGRSRDAVLSSAGDEVRLRAERDIRGDGRVYRIAFEARYGNGGTCSGTVNVSVPPKKHKGAIDSAPPSYDSFG